MYEKIVVTNLKAFTISSLNEGYGKYNKSIQAIVLRIQISKTSFVCIFLKILLHERSRS